MLFKVFSFQLVMNIDRNKENDARSLSFFAKCISDLIAAVTWNAFGDIYDLNVV